MSSFSIPDNWRILDGWSDPVSDAGNQLNQYFDADKSQLFLSAGGSSLEVLNAGVGWHDTGKLSTTVLDERLTDAMASRNFQQLQNTGFVTHCQEHQWCSVMNPWPPEPEEPEDTAHFWEHKLRGWFRIHEDTQVTALIGIGADGHIAGIFPNNRNKFADRYDTEQWVVGFAAADANHEFPTRMTITPHFIRNNIDQAVVFAVGDKKQNTLQQLVSKDIQPHNQPAQLLKNIPTTLITDQNLSA